MAVAALRAGVAALLFLGCTPQASRVPRLVIRAEVNRARPDFGVIRVSGVPRGSLERVQRPARPALVVFAIEGALSPGIPPLAGEWKAVGSDLEFHPQFAPAGGLTYVVQVDTNALAGREPSAGVVIERFSIPADPASTLTPTVTIHPSADTLPENLLRWYLEFSTPMEPGQALAHVRLVGHGGREVPRAFLELTEELWDPSGRRLTLLFDPGRVKQGIRANRDSGRPLQEGRTFILRIEPGWTNRLGGSLSDRVEKRFLVGPVDHRGPDPRAWTLTTPVVGSRTPLEIGLGEPLDHALVERLLAVLDSSGRPIVGRVHLFDADSRWRFIPAEPWGPGRHRLLVSPELEDVAGNRPGRAFDTDMLAPIDTARSPGRPLVLWFTPRR